MTERETERLTLLRHYVADADGRAILARVAHAIRVAHSANPASWCTTLSAAGKEMTLNVGPLWSISLKSNGKITIGLLPDRLPPDAQERLTSEVWTFKKFPELRGYTFGRDDAGSLMESIGAAHDEAISKAATLARRTPYYKSQDNSVVSFLNEALDLDLPRPDYGATSPTPEDRELALLRQYAASETGRMLLASMAKSIKVAHADNPANWCTTKAGSSGYVAMNVGNACAIRLHDDEIRILLMPENLDEGVRGRLEDATHHSWARESVPGARSYMLRWPQAAQLWGSLEEAHHAAIKAAHRKSATSRRHHSTAIVDYLNRELGLALPQPDYGSLTPAAEPKLGENGMEDTGTKTMDFEALIQTLRDAKLHFSSEVVANYVLALQVKRFAILTGISGTGKTQIAMAVARSFPATIRDRQAAELDGSAAPDDTVRMTARPFHFKWHQIVLPVRFVAEVESFLAPGPGSASRMIEVAYPGGLAKLRFYREPNRNVTWLLFAGAHDFRDWYAANLRPGDEYLISFREGEELEDHQIEIRLAETEVTERELANYEVVPVRPDWVDNRGLLGYLNPLTGEYATTPFLLRLLEARAEAECAEKEGRNPHPFFVVLDEMNLARVEHYFSDFLSVLESDEPIPLHESEEVEEGRTESGAVVPRRLRVPSNVFFTGTVNVDETTYMFSPKVLDRAFTIEFDRVDLDGFTTGIHADEEAGLSLDGGDGGLRLTPYRKPERDDWLKFGKLGGGRFHRTLLELHAILEEEHRHFGYRVANEIARFVNLAREQSANADESAKAAFDLALLQKVLPKFHGTQQELESLLERLFNFALYGRERTRGDAAVELDDWTVENGRLTPKGKAASRTGVPAGMSQRDAGGSAGETEGPGSENGTDAGDGAVEGPDPEFPRTAAKIWRMLRRLRQRGFAAFIE